MYDTIYEPPVTADKSPIKTWHLIICAIVLMFTAWFGTSFGFDNMLFIVIWSITAFIYVGYVAYIIGRKIYVWYINLKVYPNLYRPDPQDFTGGSAWMGSAAQQIKAQSERYRDVMERSETQNKSQNEMQRSERQNERQNERQSNEGYSLRTSEGKIEMYRLSIYDEHPLSEPELDLNSETV